MKFEGNLTNFFPPDLLIFVANLGKEGVLSVKDNLTVLSISLKDNQIIDAQSDLSDKKILKSLLSFGLLSPKNYDYLKQAQRETKMPVKQILEKLNLLKHEKIKHICLNCAREVFFEFFKLKKGFFKFTEISTGSDWNFFSLNPQTVALEISRWVDEVQELEREISSFNRVITITSKPEKPDKTSLVLLKEIGKGITIQKLIDGSPFPSFTTLKAVKQLMNQNVVTLHDIRQEDQQVSQTDDLLFSVFKDTSRKVLFSKKTNDKTKGLLDFCKSFFRHFYVLSVRNTKILRMIHFYRDNNNALKKKLYNDTHTDIKSDSAFYRIFKTGGSFFGNYFETDLIQDISSVPDKVFCSIIPFDKKGNSCNLLYVVSGSGEKNSSPFRYLEIISWMVNPTSSTVEKSVRVENMSDDKKELNGCVLDPDKKAEIIAETVNDLPPMPHVATKIMNLLSDPDYEIDQLIQLISQDQSIMVSIIKVSNSILYRATEEISTVSEAVKRLGVKTVKGIVIASATRTLFPDGKSEFNLLCHPLWVHSKECGIVSRQLSLSTGYEDPDEAFVGGILHDIGKLAILMKNMSDFKKVNKLITDENKDSIQSEKKILGYTHTEIGTHLMKQWKMPDKLVQSVKNHHNYNHSKDENKLTRIILLGDYYSHALKKSGDFHLTQKPAYIQALLDSFHIGQEDEVSLIEKLRSDLEHVDLFN